MNWDKDALSMIHAAPPAVQPMIRNRVEALAAERGVTTISQEFLASAADTHHRHSSAVSKNGSDTVNIERYFARESGNPLTDAFGVSDDVHVFADGQPLPAEQAIQAWNRAERSELSADSSHCLYLHIPFCRSRCVFCPFYANRLIPDISSEYVDALTLEIERLADTPLGRSRLDAIYFGGGTPSDLSPHDLTRLLKIIRERLMPADDAEITLEGRVWGQSSELIEAALDGGANRFSIGVQTFDTQIRQSLGRRADRGQVITFLNRLAARKAAVVIDLIFGLPGQTMEHWREDLRCLTEETRVHGVDLYRLKSVPGSVMEEMISEGRLPERADLSRSAAMFAAGIETMQRVGWERLSIAHWRRDTRERSRYNTLVKTGADCIPVGCGAGGRIGHTRFFNTRDLVAYLSDISDSKKPIASTIRLSGEYGTVDHITSQLERGRLEPSAWASPQMPFHHAVRKVLEQWTRAGLLSPANNGAMELTVAGQFWNVRMGVLLSRLVQTNTMPPETIS